MTKYDGGPAFPTHGTDGSMGPGMSLRDWFASQIIPSIINVMNERGIKLRVTYSREEIIKEVYLYADAMLKEANHD